jgi:hypothetical protein
MELGDWIISSLNTKVKFWSNNNGEALAQYNGESLAEFKLSSDPARAIEITSYGCKLAINKAGNSIVLTPALKSKE